MEQRRLRKSKFHKQPEKGWLRLLSAKEMGLLCFSCCYRLEEWIVLINSSVHVFRWMISSKCNKNDFWLFGCNTRFRFLIFGSYARLTRTLNGVSFQGHSENEWNAWLKTKERPSQTQNRKNRWNAHKIILALIVVNPIEAPPVASSNKSPGVNQSIIDASIGPTSGGGHSRCQPCKH